ncbi:nucleotide pyrophosphohydrolase [Barrientosiimonas endolithica]|uniref:Nucleotide pyrophosphohydrolase n=2 Tax=Barrientosiimonas endolithica TaxID=1535208 RepID=A0ABM8H9P8_9MICO|nr:nucleotide pyrophosphohydrolase [Barrientosiimonas endolithica]
MSELHVREWQDRLRRFAEHRDWEQFHTPKNLVMALSVEVAELVEIFQWLTPEQSTEVMGTKRAQDVRDEVADSLTYLLRLADVLNVDLDAAMADKFQRAADRYPVDEVRGSAEKR